MTGEDEEIYDEIDEYSSAIAHCAQRTVSKVIREWYVYTLKKKILIQIEDYLRSKYVKKLLSIILKEWFEYAMKESLNRVRIEYILNKKADNIKYECFRYWYYDHYINRKDLYDKYKYIQKGIQSRLVKNTYYSWNNEYKRNKMSKIFEKNRLLKSAMQVWYSEHIRLNKLFKELIKRRKMRIFITYYEYCINKHYRDKVLIERHRSFEYKILVRIFNQWVLLVKYSMSKRYNILQWQINVTNNKMIQVINQWRYYIMKKKARNGISMLIRSRHEINKKSEIFSMWLNITHDNYREKTLLIISGLTARRQLLTKGFNSFKEYLRHRKESEVLRIKSQLVLVCYIIRLFLKNSSDYCKYKLLLSVTSKRMAETKKKYYWKMWKKYVDIRNRYRCNENIIIYKHHMNILLKTYRLWNYLSNKIVTNKMIISCITMRINKNIKKKVFYSIYYLYQLIKTRFWDIFIVLIDCRRRLFLKNLYNNMLCARKEEYLENKLGDKIRLSIIYKNWKMITYYNRLILFMQNKLIIKRSVMIMMEYIRFNAIFVEYMNKKKKILVLNIIRIWSINSRKRRNVSRITEKNGGIDNIRKILSVRYYFYKWLGKYRLSKYVFQLQNRIRKNVLRYYYFCWSNSYKKNVIIGQKYEIVFDKRKKRELAHYFKNWYNFYDKKLQNEIKMNKIIFNLGNKKIRKTWKVLKMASKKRMEKKLMLGNIHIKLEMSLLRYSWNLLKGALIIDKTLERISLEYNVYINKKRLLLIYNHWRQLYNYIINMRDKESISRTCYYSKTTKKHFLCWRELYINILNSEKSFECHILNNIKHKLASRIIRKWMFRVEMNKKMRIMRSKIVTNNKKRILYCIIYVYNKYILYKKRIIDCLNVEYVNSYIFKLQYNRVIVGSNQTNITFYDSLIMYGEYKTLRIYTFKWLKMLYSRIQYKNTLEKESERLCLLFEYINKRNALSCIVNWKNYVNTKYEIIKKSRKNNIYKEIIGVMSDIVKSTQFKINISDILYSNYLMKKASKGIQYWRSMSKYKIKCRSNYNVINCIIERNIVKNVFNKWINESQEYVMYYLLIKYSLRPFKMRYFKVLKYNHYYKIIQEKRLLLLHRNWHGVVLKRKELESRCEYYRNNIIYTNTKRNYTLLWYFRYRQKMALYGLYKKINVQKPMYNIYNKWLFITKERRENENLLVNRIETRQKKLLLKTMILSYRILVFSRKNAKRIKDTVYNLWKLLHNSSKELRKRKLRRCISAWIKYCERRIHYTNIYNEIRLVRDRNTKMICFRDMLKAYNKRISLSKKVSSIKNKIKLRYIMFWRNAILKKERLNFVYNKVSSNINTRVVSNCYFKWRNKYNKSVLINNKYETYQQNVRIRVLCSYYKTWKLGWVPHRYIKNGKSMINILNKIQIHTSFHKLLKYTYYSSKTATLTDNNTLVNTDILTNFYVRKSYYIECRCTYNSISRIRMEARFDWILDLFSLIRKIKNGFILSTMAKFRDYVRIREKYHQGFSAFEFIIKKIVLERVWLVYKVNSYRIGTMRDGMKKIISKINKRIKFKYLVYWVNKYNLNKRDEMIIQKMRDSYNRNITIKCYLIWCIKYYKNKRKKILYMKIYQFQVMYVFKYTFKKFNEYFLYNKWLAWCKKAYDTIELVNKFRLKSNCFLIWNKYTNKQKILKDKVLVFYKGIITKILVEVYYNWKNRYMKIVDINNKSISHYNDSLHKRIYLVFINWKRHSFFVRNVRKKLITYIHSKNNKIINTYFKLWKFFNYYRKTRTERFDKITNIIVSNHNRAIAYRIFYSWKLKMIESLSLKNSIFLSWNINNKTSQSDYSGDEFINSGLSARNNLNEGKVGDQISNNRGNIIKEKLFSSSSSGSSTYNRNRRKDKNKDDYYNLTNDRDTGGFQQNKINPLSDGDLEIDDLDSTKRRDNYETSRFLEYHSVYTRNMEGNINYFQPQIVPSNLNMEEETRNLTAKYNNNSHYVLEYENEDGNVNDDEHYYFGKKYNNQTDNEESKNQKVVIHSVINNLPDIHIADNPYEFISSPLKLSGSTANPRNAGNKGIHLFSSSSSSLSSLSPS
ncbi:hypothetical protein FG379_003090 [Cryptosporidium bovis]|uniref:uncharacterized protein n=1 Tax=Cryptosporidium bovis TaxID=310047 RepID=UPI00351A4F0E|nr:hypothetical protein FG379_003090 [Cryptosporidium bovis]